MCSAALTKRAGRHVRTRTVATVDVEILVCSAGDLGNACADVIEGDIDGARDVAGGEFSFAADVEDVERLAARDPRGEVSGLYGRGAAARAAPPSGDERERDAHDQRGNYRVGDRTSHGRITAVLSREFKTQNYTAREAKPTCSSA